MKPTKDILSDISRHTYNQITHYTFNRGTLKVDEKYREGRLTALNYVSELTFYYMNLEKEIHKQFREQINHQMKSNSCLPQSSYKDGLYDALNEVLDEYKKINIS
ncbi:hypothetical protein MNB_SV-3-161 [hydrothermal vent metagenome]|uniref:Uncharacterized protein n=1 Tax=hydrothermal vent metagenome TaxID=652676 RepID=A0A1W1BR36_9ZZZZ